MQTIGMIRHVLLSLALLLTPLAANAESTPVNPQVVIKTSEGDSECAIANPSSPSFATTTS